MSFLRKKKERKDEQEIAARVQDGQLRDSTDSIP